MALFRTNDKANYLFKDDSKNHLVRDCIPHSCFQNTDLFLGVPSIREHFSKWCSARSWGRAVSEFRQLFVRLLSTVEHDHGNSRLTRRIGRIHNLDSRAATIRVASVSAHTTSRSLSQTISSISGCSPSGGQRSKLTFGHCEENSAWKRFRSSVT